MPAALAALVAGTVALTGNALVKAMEGRRNIYAMNADGSGR